VDSDSASYKQKLEVLREQEELIEDEQEQEQKEEDARRARREAEQQEADTARSLLPDSEVRTSLSAAMNVSDSLQLLPEESENARMTTEQLKELSEALSVLSAKSSVIKERDELRALVEENSQVEKVCSFD